MDKLKVCPDCQGEGQIPIRENRVTHEMALDAGYPEMEGSSCGIEYAQCQRCQGGGLFDSEEENCRAEKANDPQT